MRRCPNEWKVLRVFLPNTETCCFGRENQRRLGAGPQMNPTKSKAFCGYSTLGIVVWESTEYCVLSQRRLRFCKVVGLNSLVRQFGLRFHCNGVEQSAKDYLKACPACHGILPFLPCSLHYTLSVPRAHLNGYRLILLIWQLARSGHCKWSPISLSYPIRYASC